MATPSDRDITAPLAQAGPEILPVAGWERFPWLRAGFSTRHGGRSEVYGPEDLNLGWATGDDPGLIAANRAAFVHAVADGAAMDLVTVSQVHGTVVRDLEAETEPFTAPDGRARLEGDGLLTRTPGRLLAVLTADCVPVLVADVRTHAVAAFHAGWRGTVAGIVERGVAQLLQQAGSRPEDLVAAIGPSIGACCFEVGDEVQTAFHAAYAYADDLFQAQPAAKGKAHLDLQKANLRQLRYAGLPHANVSVLGHCTGCSRAGEQRRFFSYRLEGGHTGRMLSAIGTIS